MSPLDPHPSGPPPLRADLLDDVLEAVAAEPAPTRPAIRRRVVALGITSVVVASAVFMAYGGLRRGGAPRPVGEIVATALGAALIAAGAAWSTTGRRSMLAPSSRALWAIALGVPVALLGWKLAWSATFPGGLDPWPGRVGWPCLQISLASGLLPVVLGLGLRRGSAPDHPRLLGAALGTVAGAFAWVVTDLWCPVGHLPHLLLGHVLPVLLFALAGAWVGGRWLAVRWSPA